MDSMIFVSMGKFVLGSRVRRRLALSYGLDAFEILRLTVGSWSQNSSRVGVGVRSPMGIPRRFVKMMAPVLFQYKFENPRLKRRLPCMVSFPFLP